MHNTVYVIQFCMDTGEQTNNRLSGADATTVYTARACRMRRTILRKQSKAYSTGMRQKNNKAVNHQNSALLLRCSTHIDSWSRAHTNTPSQMTERFTSHFSHSLGIFWVLCCAKANLHNFEFISWKNQQNFCDSQKSRSNQGKEDVYASRVKAIASRFAISFGSGGIFGRQNTGKILRDFVSLALNPALIFHYDSHGFLSFPTL